VLLSFTAGCATPAPLFSARVEVKPVEAASQRLVGRLRVSSSDGFRRVMQETSTTGVEVWTEAHDGSTEATWARALAALPAGSERARLDWGDGVRAVVWHEANDRLLQVMKPFEDHVLWLRRDFPEGKLAIAERLFRELLRVYTPHGREGFGVEHGAFQRVAQLENAMLTLEGASSGVRLRLTCRSTIAAEVRAPSDVAREVEAAGGRLEVLRAGPRTVAGLPGTELVLKLTARGLEPTVRCEWAHRGAPSSRDPGVSLEAVGPATSAAALEQAWEQVVRTLEVDRPR
jgi:hypothetical protein